jgi:hypothetical protein
MIVAAAETIDPSRLIASLGALPLGGLSLRRYGSVKGVADEIAKFILSDAMGRPVGMLHLSSEVSPNLAARGAAMALDAARSLGAAGGSHVLQAAATGVCDGRTFAVYPYQAHLSRWRVLRAMQRVRLRGYVLQWLRSIAESTTHDLAQADREASVVEPLRFIERAEGVSVEARSIAREAIDRIAQGRWTPRAVLMHGDLWSGNILLDPTRPFRARGFCVIDWAGATARGFGVYDLVRLGMSFRLTPARLRREIEDHCGILECEPRDGLSHLVAALGVLGRQRECFPFDRYVAMANRCVRCACDAMQCG